MEAALISPAKAFILGIIPAAFFSLLFPIVGIGIFAYIIAKRLAPLVLSEADFRMDRLPERAWKMIKYAIGQYRQPRYMLAGVIHIAIFAGFMIISLHSITLVIMGLKDGYTLPLMDGTLGHIYGILKDLIATVVLAGCIGAMINRLVIKPKRYEVPPALGKPHTSEAIFVLLMISGLMIADSLFEGTLAAAEIQKGMATSQILVPLTLTWFFTHLLGFFSPAKLQSLHLCGYFTHELIFFTFLNFLPFGKHFHVITSIPNVFFAKLNKGSVKPVRWGIDETKLDELKTFGVKKFEDFTWKNILDFYSCADCGRCSDQCPANAVGRPLSPRFISIKAREYAFKHYPLKGDFTKGDPLIGSIYSEDEIWSCTTCGACEEECPIFIEYIDKIVDLRRGMVDDGSVPKSLQKALQAIEKRGNPWGKMEKKRADWVNDLPETCTVKMLDEGDTAETLYFADSITCYDDRIQEIGKATARVLSAAGVDFGILGKSEKDSGHDVRRFGEEMLFQDLKSQNTEAILEAKVKRIVTADPHAYNALKKDYKDLPPVFHISEIIADAVTSGKIKLKNVEDPSAIYAYHDPCYLGRHNEMYDIPRQVLDAIPGLTRVEMEKCRDRSFCCGGGGLMLFYEPVEETRMGRLRVEMAAKAGATVIVTACPFCMVNLEDAIKTSGLEGKLVAIDLVELIDRHLA